MTAPDCPRTALVEALRDGRLGPQESASMQRHIEGCAACSELARDLSQIGDLVRTPLDRLTPLEHQRARVALLQRAATQSPVRVASEGRRYVFGAVLLAAAVVLGFVGGRWESPSNHVATALHMGALPIIANGSKLGLHPSDDARFTRNRTADVDELMLDHGVIDVKLHKLEAGKRFVVRTKDAQIDVRATAFRVEAEEGRIRSVAVEQGTVEVQYAGFTAVIPAGGSWRATADSTESAKPATKTEADIVSPAAAINAPTRITTQSINTPKTLRGGSPRDIVRIEKPSPETFDIAPAPEKPENIEPSPIAEQPTPTAAPPLPSPASRTFADAMAAMRRGDYVGGAEKLEQFSQTHAGDARADEADYLHAIALQRAGRRAEAIAAAKRYLAKRSNGAHRADAARIVGH